MLKKNFVVVAFHFGILIFFFTLARILFFFYYRQQFLNIPVSEILFSIFHGIRFDLVVLAKTQGPIYLSLFLLGNWSWKTPVYRLLSWLSLVFVLLYFSIYVSDLGYFGLVQRHISFDFLLVIHELSGAVGQVFKKYFILLALYCLILPVIGYYWLKLWKRFFLQPAKPSPWWQHAIVVPFFFVLLVIAGRGGIQTKPTTESYAFQSKYLPLGHLTLNSVYTVIRFFEFYQVKPLKYLDDDEANSRIANLLLNRKNQIPDSKHPLKRKADFSPGKTQIRPNIVLIVMEGWPSRWMGMTSKKDSDTPFFDELSKKGLLFTRYIASGTYTSHGIASMLASIPVFPNINFVTSSYVQNRYSSIPGILNKRGYHTLFQQGYFPGSSRVDRFMRALGIEKIITQFDFKNYEQISDRWGIWDEYSFDRFHEEIGKLEEPFLAILHTSTTHSPGEVPDPKWNHHPPGTFEGEWRNTLRYSDASMKRFFEKAPTHNSYANTLFIVTSDHTSYVDRNEILNGSRIPLLFYTPNGDLKPGKNNTIGMQQDLLPTVMDYLGLRITHSSAGQSLFSKNPDKAFAVHFSGQFYFWFQKGAIVRFSTSLKPDAYHEFEKDWITESRLIKKTKKDQLGEIEKNLKSYLQVFNNAILFNSMQ